MSGEAMVKFLLVEDDDDHAELVRIALQDNHVTNAVERVPDGREAIACLRKEGRYAESPRPDVILLDLKLPIMDGHEVLAVLKDDEELREIPVVVLTTSEADVDKTRAYKNYVNSYLVKPVDFDKFHDMVRDLKLYWGVWNQKPGLK